jgi:hypothetical protein
MVNHDNKEQSPETLNLLKSLEGFDAGTLPTLHEMQLEPLSSISEATSTLWSERTTTHPRLFPSANCWTAPEPSTATLVLSTLNYLSDPTNEIDCSVFQRGDKVPEGFDARLAIAQLVEPSQASPVHLIGLKVPEVEDRMFQCPMELSEWVEPYLESAHQLLLTPKWTISDLHAGK